MHRTQDVRFKQLAKNTDTKIDMRLSMLYKNGCTILEQFEVSCHVIQVLDPTQLYF